MNLRLIYLVYTACLPSLRPLVNLIVTGSAQSVGHSGPSEPKTSKQASAPLPTFKDILPKSLKKDHAHPFNPLPEILDSSISSDQPKADGKAPGIEMSNMRPERDGIRVRTDILLERP